MAVSKGEWKEMSDGEYFRVANGEVFPSIMRLKSAYILDIFRALSRSIERNATSDWLITCLLLFLFPAWPMADVHKHLVLDNEPDVGLSLGYYIQKRVVTVNGRILPR
jgi:hypothetical protein